ncbi:MAG: DUF2726 domain-containing protein [Desulfobulbus sp.]|nr:DUF2726 domain-containing protein [Desulfobulbus sp.]
MVTDKTLLAMILIAVGMIILAAIVKKLKTQERGNRGEYPYKKVDSLFTAAERSFFGVLEDAVGDQFRIFGKVRIADIATVKSISDRSAWRRAVNRITGKHLDYILCDKDNLSIICGIELNDKSHKQQNRQERDNFIENLCKKISLPLVTIQAQRAYSVPEIRTAILKALEGSTGVTRDEKRGEGKKGGLN